MFSINKEELFLGAPYKLGNICKIYQLTLREIMLDDNAIGFDKYSYYINLLTLDTTDIKDIFEKKGLNIKELGFDDITAFKYLLLSAENDNNFFLDLKTALSTFIKEEIMISPKSNMIIVGNPKERRFILEKDFDELANAIRAFNNMRIKQPPPENETAFQKKFRLKREQRDKVKEKQNKNEDNVSFVDVMSSICTMNVGITALTLPNYTIYQIKNLLERSLANEKYHTELDMLIAGADSKKIKAEHYMRNLSKEVN